MRCLMIASEFPPGPGGIGTHAYELAKNLSDLTWSVSVLTSQDYASDEEILKFNSSQNFAVSRFKKMSSSLAEGMHRYRFAVKHIETFQPDVLIATGSRSVWIASIVSKRRGIPWTAIGHGSEFGIRNPIYAFLTRRGFSRADGVICVSNYTWKRMIEFGITPRSGVVIPNGANSERFKRIPQHEIDSYKQKMGFASDRIITTVGNVTDRKGQETIIRAMPRILRVAPTARYVLAGLPTKKAELERIASDLGVSERITFLGPVRNEDLIQLVNACDVFAMTSRNMPDGDFEGYGIAVVEAALCGKPSVVTSGSGLSEAIVDGRTGIEVPQNDPESTAIAILSLLQDDALRLRMGQAAYDRAWSEQTWDRRVVEYDKFLRKTAKAESNTIPASEARTRSAS